VFLQIKTKIDVKVPKIKFREDKEEETHQKEGKNGLNRRKSVSGAVKVKSGVVVVGENSPIIK
jgi:hypothetical protein